MLIPTSELRFILRADASSTMRPLRILQQKWVVDQDSVGVQVHNPDQYSEWRDIPFIEDV